MRTALLLTVGAPERLRGSYLYHRRVADLAVEHGWRLGFLALPELPFPWPALAVRRALAAAVAERPAVLVVDSHAAPFLAFAGRSVDALPLVASVHVPPADPETPPWARGLRARWAHLTYRRARRIVVASRYLLDVLAAAGLADRLVLVPPGRDLGPEPAVPARAAPPEAGLMTALAAARATQRPTIDPLAGIHERQGATTAELRAGREMALLCVARWTPRHGILTLLAALAALPPAAATLHLVGDPTGAPRYAAQVHARLAAADLRERVRVHGVLGLPELATLYRHADLFVLPSPCEPVGMGVGEAMALGLPIVAVAAGNLPYLVTDGVEGRLLAQATAAELRAALAELAAAPAVRARLGQAARRRALELPRWQETAERFYAVLAAAAQE
jgi:glycosyltransferase involved in cell wall biosynthesis